MARLFYCFRNLRVVSCLNRRRMVVFCIRDGFSWFFREVSDVEFYIDVDRDVDLKVDRWMGVWKLLTNFSLCFVNLCCK